MLPAAIKLVLVLFAVANAPKDNIELPGFRKSPWFEERVRDSILPGGVRALANAPASFDPKKPTRLILYATPNGSTIEQTLGCGGEGLDWRFDIQHVAAQVRKLREISPNENTVLVCIEAEGLSWPAWKRKFTDAPARIKKVVEMLRQWIAAEKVRVSVTAHSGGGSFLFGLLDSSEIIPEFIERIAFLDANYSYSDSDKHGDKLLAWLKADLTHRLVVIVYDDRKVTLNDKLVVGPDGGTFRATERMQARFAGDVQLTRTTAKDIDRFSGLDGRLELLVHANPKNIILHTALVGEMNGLLHALAASEAVPAWGSFGGPRAYTKWVQPAPVIPKRPENAVGGRDFIKSLDKLSAGAREEAIEREILTGNIPDFLRKFQQVTVSEKDAAGKVHTAVFEVMPDYLAIGSDQDFVRVPMMPKTAARIAEAFGCSLPTRKMVNDIYRAATVKLQPKPMAEDRELPVTFLRHNSLIEEQRTGKKLGELVAGVKKDVVVSNRLAEKSNRVAIYGWHEIDGQAIQPLSIVHSEAYVDYSHGIRFVNRIVQVDGKPWDVRQVFYSTNLCTLLSDEGPIAHPTY